MYVYIGDEVHWLHALVLLYFALIKCKFTDPWLMWNHRLDVHEALQSN